MNCKQLTKNHKLTCEKLTQNHINAVITQEEIILLSYPRSFSLFANDNQSTKYKAYETSKSFLTKYFQKKTFRCGS